MDGMDIKKVSRIAFKIWDLRWKCMHIGKVSWIVKKHMGLKTNTMDIVDILMIVYDIRKKV